MPTSELSDALNPYYAQLRSRTTQSRPQPSQPSQQHPPHRSELELAISEQPRAPVTPPIGHVPARSSGGIHAVQELLRFLASTREAQEIERKRRIAWEQEQEAKYKLRQAEMERRMLEMQQEITALKARVAFSVPMSLVQSKSQVLAPSSQQPTPSTSPTLSHSSTPATLSSPAVNQPVTTDLGFDASTSGSYLPSPMMPPTRFVNVDPSSSRRYSMTMDTEDELNTDDDFSPQHRVRRKNHHDTRCLTIQVLASWFQSIRFFPHVIDVIKHAVRNHLLRVMMLETDKNLPDSHVEGTPFGPDEPVRFVWDKTPRQSVHNARMKERVLKDLKANRKQYYKHVPDKEFGKKTLDSVFDQAFVTLRQKFKAQRDESTARAHKQREDLKAQRARRLSRRKVKLGNRSDARNKMAAFEDVTFDGALQMECMSSEESEVEEDAAGTRTTFFRIRGFAWRSLRLQRFFDALDEEDKADNMERPRRGVGRKERIRGPPKEGILVPPKGVSSWMVSKRWVRVMEVSHLEVVGMLKEIVVDVEPTIELGEESE